MKHIWWLAVAAAAAACGGDNVNHLKDAPGQDAPEGIDTGVDAPLAPVTLATTIDGAPGAGVIVYFLNVDSTVVLATTTGSDGTASAVMRAGGSVTAIAPNVAGGTVVPAAITPANQQLDTFAGVQPGDVLHLDYGNGPGAMSITFDVTVDADANVAALTYELDTTCGTANLTPPLALAGKHPATSLPPATVTLSGCNGVADMLVRTFDGNNQPLDSLYTPAVAVADGSAVTLTGTYTPIAAQVETVTNIPTDVSLDFAESFFVTANGVVFGSSGAAAVGSDGTTTVTYQQPVVTGAVEALARGFGGDSTVQDNQTFTDWGAPGPLATTLDATAPRLPEFTAQPAFDSVTQQVTWTPSGGGSADAIYVDLSFDRAGSNVDDPHATWNWDILAPAEQLGAVQYPSVPNDQFNWLGRATDVVGVDDVELGSNPGGYDAVRPNGIDLDFDRELDTSTASGHVTTDTYASAPAELRAGAKVRPGRRLHARAWRTRR